MATPSSRATILTILTAIILSSCNASNDSNFSNGTVVATGCEQILTATCERWQTCVPEYFQVMYGTVENCKAADLPICIQLRSLPGQNWTSVAFGNCTDSIRSMTCDQFYVVRMDGRLCDVPAGSFANGAACLDSAQCQSRACSGNLYSCGVCVAQVGVGEECQASDSCPRPQICLPKTDRLASVCTTRTPIGERCDSHTWCAVDTICQNGTCAAHMGLGDECDEASGQSFCDSMRGLACNPTTHRCETYLASNAGEPCGQVNDTHRDCTFGSVCQLESTTTGTCHPQVVTGQACNDSMGSICYDYDECANGVCTPRPIRSCQ